MRKNKKVIASLAIAASVASTLLIAAPATAAGCTVALYLNFTADTARASAISNCSEVGVSHKFSPTNTPYVGWTSPRYGYPTATSYVARQLITGTASGIS